MTLPASQSTYLTLMRSSKSTNAHTLPLINLMKNSASELFCVDHPTAYQHAFGYIRQLAIHLRNSMKIKTKVRICPYNVQYYLTCTSMARKRTSRCTTGNMFIVLTSGALFWEELVTFKQKHKLANRARSGPWFIHSFKSALGL